MSKTTVERAFKLQADAASAGFDWPTLEGIFQKLEEEIGELRSELDAGRKQPNIEAEFGDLLFVLINLARRLDISPDKALAAACDKFERRYGHVCGELRKAGRRPENSSLDEMEELWQEAKRLEDKNH